MKRKHIDTKTFAGNLPPPSPTFAADTMAQLRALAAKEEEIPMKRKAFTGILVAALLLALLAATALAAYTIRRSEQADAVSRARGALSADYGLTPETTGLFYFVSEQEGGTWTVTFYADGFYPPLLGDYTVILAPGKDPETRWTHDDVDPAVWQDGSLDAPVWGQPQMLRALQDKEAAAAFQAQVDWSLLPAAPRVTPPPLENPMADDEYYWNGHILREATPGPNDISEEEATALARQALVEETSLTQKVLETADVTVNFYERDTGNPIWGFQFYVVDAGIEQGCGVMVDARTGEILLTAVTTGGNG